MKRWHVLLISIAALPLVAADSCSGGTATPLTSTPGGSTTSAAPVAAAPAVLKVTGKGSKVPHITLAAVTYVVSWTAKGGTCFSGAGCIGDNFQVDVQGSGGSDDNIVNEVTSNNIKKGSTGETSYTVTGAGVYLLKVVASSLTWTITFTPA